MSSKIKDIPASERPRERFIKYGRENLKTSELISIILNTGTKDKSVLELSNNIINSIKDISQLKDMTLNKLKKIDGIGEVKAIKLLSAIELGKRVYYDKNWSKIKLNTIEKVYEYMKSEFNDSKQECFYALYLDTKKNLIEKKLLFKGTLNKSIVHPREIFKNAYLLSASSIICVHNHPSGDSTPSKDDIILTNSLVDIGKIQGVQIIDHIIIGNDYYSFYENGNI
ncbi:MAG: DNA repair protein RadC [Bacilli bacterium]|nr:DNA repair protein RadC [Bacilli bacterium]